MRPAREEVDPDVREVFAEMARKEAAEAKAKGLPSHDELPPIEPLEMLDEDEESIERLSSRKVSLEEAQQLRDKSMRQFEDSLAHMKKSLDAPTGDAAVDAASKRVYAASMAMLERTRAGRPGVSDMRGFVAVIQESHAAYEALWLANLERFRRTCSPEMRPKADKAIAWQTRQIAEMKRLNEESAQAMAELQRLREKP